MHSPRMQPILQVTTRFSYFHNRRHLSKNFQRFHFKIETYLWNNDKNTVSRSAPVQAAACGLEVESNYPANAAYFHWLKLRLEIISHSTLLKKQKKRSSGEKIILWDKDIWQIETVQRQNALIISNCVSQVK